MGQSSRSAWRLQVSKSGHDCRSKLDPYRRRLPWNRQNQSSSCPLPAASQAQPQQLWRPKPARLRWQRRKPSAAWMGRQIDEPMGRGGPWRSFETPLRVFLNGEDVLKVLGQGLEGKTVLMQLGNFSCGYKLTDFGAIFLFCRDTASWTVDGGVITLLFRSMHREQMASVSIRVSCIQLF